MEEGLVTAGHQGTGSWEKSAISARFFLKCELRSRFIRSIYQEIFPWQAYSNQDGYLALNPKKSRTASQSSVDGGSAHVGLAGGTCIYSCRTSSRPLRGRSIRMSASGYSSCVRAGPCAACSGSSVSPNSNSVGHSHSCGLSQCCNIICGGHRTTGATTHPPCCDRWPRS